MDTSSEKSLSALVSLLVFLLGWIRAFAVCQDVSIDDIAESDYWQLLWVSLRMLAPYLEVWAVLAASIMVLIIVDCNLAMVAGLLPNGALSMGDGYATLVFMGAFWSWQVILAIGVTMTMVLVCSMALMYYVKVQRNVRSQEPLLRYGLVLIHIFGICLGVCLLIVQGFFVRV